MITTLERRTMSRAIADTGTTGTPADALVSGQCPTDPRWNSLQDELLRWKSQGGAMFDENDAPSGDVLDTAIDFTYDLNREWSAPTTVTAAGGRIAFEWHQDRDALILEVCGQGLIEVTEFEGGRVVNEYFVRRNPVTRKLQHAQAALESR